MSTRYVGVKELRQNMAKITKRAQNKQERIVVLRNNMPIFELRPLSKKDAALEKLTMDINEALEDVKAGRLYTIEEISKELGLNV